MRAIYKYKLTVQDTVDLCIPEGAKILTLQMQQGCPCIWAEVNPQAPTEERTFAIRGTGLDGNPLATWKATTTNRIDTKVLRAEYPEIAEKVTQASVSRRLLIK